MWVIEMETCCQCEKLGDIPSKSLLLLSVLLGMSLSPLGIYNKNTIDCGLNRNVFLTALASASP